MARDALRLPQLCVPGRAVNLSLTPLWYVSHRRPRRDLHTTWVHEFAPDDPAAQIEDGFFESQMIIDEPDEDAALLDDAAVSDAYLNAAPPSQNIDPAVPEPPEWPVMAEQIVDFTLNATTLDWFKDHHVDWQREIGLILDAWVIMQKPDAQVSAIQKPV